MSEEEVRALLNRGRRARLGCVVEGEPYIVLVSYLFEDDCAYIHALPGVKITALRVNPRACLQVDEIEDECRWQSVLATGNFEEITDAQESAYYLHKLLERFPLLTPVESVRARDAAPPPVIVFRIRIDKLTGTGER